MTANIRNSKAFTLIELLIVVAIIAILAAIAVPNFLEAQVRSKVSRVKSDMRAMATAMEAYAVDNNVYPIPSDEQGRFFHDPVNQNRISPFETKVPITLTTPIAYLSTRPTDPFALNRVGEPELYHVVTYDYVLMRHFNRPLVNWLAVYRQFFRQLIDDRPPASARYYFNSFGPNQVHNADIPHVTAPSGPHQHLNAAIYDPTNGTISSGDSLYFGPGIGFLDGR